MKTQSTAHYGPQFTASRKEREIIRRIALRAVHMAVDLRVNYDFQSAWMDIEACHCNGCPLGLSKLEQFPDGDFCHDTFGIRRFIDRETGKLTQCFVPRCALPENAVIQS